MSSNRLGPAELDAALGAIVAASGVERDAVAIARSLDSLRTLSSEGAPPSQLAEVERATWALGAKPSDTQSAIEEGADLFAKTIVVGGSRHWVWGSGMAGCLYDSGPGVATSLASAIDSVLFPFFDDMTAEQASAARRELTEVGVHYLPKGMGAQYCEVQSCSCDNPSQHEEF